MTLRAVNPGEVGQSQLTNETFQQLVVSEKIQNITQDSIGVLIGANYQIPALTHKIVTLPQQRRALGANVELRFGYCHTQTIPGADETILVVTGDFPIFINGQPEISDTEAGNTASAVYARALDLFQGALTFAQKRKGVTSRMAMQGYRELDWKNRYFTPARALPYRAAGLVALSTLGVNELSLNYDVELPPQVVGLKNPLVASSITGIRPFAKILQDYTKYREPSNE